MNYSMLCLPQQTAGGGSGGRAEGPEKSVNSKKIQSSNADLGLKVFN
jgi:hypothetical protein